MINEIYLKPNHEKSCFYPNFKDENEVKQNYEENLKKVL